MNGSSNDRLVTMNLEWMSGDVQQQVGLLTLVEAPELRVSTVVDRARIGLLPQ